MRARLWLSFASLGPLLLVGSLAAEGCSSTTTDAPTAQDSGADAPKDGPSDVVVTDSAQACVDADITKFDVPDADIGDAGGNTAACAACLKKNCSGELDVCQNDCDCREGVVEFYKCVSTGKSITSCGGSLYSAGSSAQQLGLCALNSGCAEKCGAPVDAGLKDAASSDAPADGG